MIPCSDCRKVFRDTDYDDHECETPFSQLPIEEIAERIFDSKKDELDWMLETGEIVQSYYDQEYEKILEEYNEQCREQDSSD